MIHIDTEYTINKYTLFRKYWFLKPTVGPENSLILYKLSYESLFSRKLHIKKFKLLGLLGPCGNK